MSIEKYIRNKHTYITSRLARMFLIAKVGDSIPTINDLTQIFNVGSGTVQSALQQLKVELAIAIEARGFLGSYLTKLDYRKLWELSDFGVLMGLCPLATGKEILAISEGIYKSFSLLDVHIQIAFMPGSINRINNLINEKSDFVVMSELSYLQAKQEQEPVVKALSLGDGSYGQKRRLGLLFPKQSQPINKLVAGWRIGINKYSYGQVFLVTRLAQELGLECVYKERFELMNSLHNGEVEAVVVDLEQSGLALDKYSIYGLERYELIQKAMPQAEKAVVVVRDDNIELKKILSRRISADIVKGLQTSG